MLLADAQTSGGLLMCVQPEMLAVLIAGLDGRSPDTAVIGEVTEGLPGWIRVEG